MKPRFVLKKKKIPARGGQGKIDNWEIWDTKENRKYNDCIVYQFAKNLCDQLNQFYETNKQLDKLCVK